MWYIYVADNHGNFERATRQPRSYRGALARARRTLRRGGIVRGETGIGRESVEAIILNDGNIYRGMRRV